eukprot:TRINITY_DN10005_c0_g1_i1.p1 TRINITY_DN10005_c0_g1~~TRINITY_DN10005_c0_g1_i1.p1  ORF type:complete len:519 (+),score=182.55 TRINITY_DN10005_c0_g1_i1:103-1659(+)
MTVDVAASSGVGTGLAGASKLVTKMFLEDKHYSRLNRILGQQWKGCHKLYAAIKLMEAHGVQLSAEEEERLQHLPEEHMIDELVSRMPQQNREQFEHFFLQLSLIASTTSRLRAALEEGTPIIIEEALDSAESTGIIQFLLKMAVVQAGQEVSAHDENMDDWSGSNATRMVPLLKHQDECIQNQKILLQTQEELDVWKDEKMSGARNVLTRMMDANDESFLGGVYGAWLELTRKAKLEREIHAEYEQQLAALTKEMLDFRSRQCKTLHKHLFRDTATSDRVLKQRIMDGFRQQVLDQKDYKAHEKEHKALQKELMTVSEDKRAKAKNVLARMSTYDTESLINLCFTGLQEVWREGREAKAAEALLEKKQAALTEYIKTANPNAQRAMSMFTGGMDTNMLGKLMEGWVKIVAESKEAARLEIVMKEKGCRLNEFVGRRKGMSHKELERRCQVIQDGTMSTIVQIWKRDTVIERMRRFGKDRTTKRKQQLDGVKTLFKSFANELETGLSEGTPRVDFPKR